MISITMEVLGGVGLFLLGMGLMTEGLKAMAGDTIRSTLIRCTRSPLSGVTTGTLSTAVLQSSSATIIATVGFVGAGLLTYSQALGIVLGASIGTTFTGWLVAIVGFKFKLGLLASLLVLIGALLRLFGGTRRSGLAYSLAGFGLIFVGIGTLQEGMASVQGLVDFSQFAGTGMGVRLQLVVAGVIFTIITQSSSAGVVAALAALHSGVINFDQAAALVIGMNTGTTFTSAVATIGGDANVRRTGFSHVIYNIIVSLGAIFLISPYVWAWQKIWPAQLYSHAEIALVGFHTSFNLVGVLLVLPFIRYYARMMERLIPERPVGEHAALDQNLLKYPELALTSVQKSLAEQTQVLAQRVLYTLGEMPRSVPVAEVLRQLEQAQQYVDKVYLEDTSSGEWKRLLAAIHLIDHLQRLYDRCQNKAVLLVLHNPVELQHARELLLQVVGPYANQQLADREKIKKVRAELHAHEKELRQQITRQIAEGTTDMKQGVSLMEAARWLQRVSVHLARIDKFTRQLSYDKEVEKEESTDDA